MPTVPYQFHAFWVDKKPFVEYKYTQGCITLTQNCHTGYSKQVSQKTARLAKIMLDRVQLLVVIYALLHVRYYVYIDHIHL